MSDALSTIRTNVRLEVKDPSPERIPDASTTFTHDGGNAAAFFEDSGENFVTHGVEVGMVIYNVTDGSFATIKNISNGGGTNARLEVQSIEGGTDNDYDNADVVRIYDRYAQNGLGNEKWSDARILRAINRAQKVVAMRQGGIQKTELIDVLVFSKIDLVNVSGTYTAGEQITGGDNDHQATVFFVGTDYLIIKDMITRVPIDTVVGTFLVGEKVTGGTNSYTGIVQEVNAAYLDLYDPSGEFADDEALTGGTSGATCLVNSATSYSSNLFIAAETLTGGTSSVTGDVKETYTSNNINIGQDIPTRLLKPDFVRFWTGSIWRTLDHRYIDEIMSRTVSSGDPREVADWGDKLWFWPNKGNRLLNLVQINGYFLPADLSADTDTSELDAQFMMELTLEAARILAGWDGDEILRERIMQDLRDMVITGKVRKDKAGSQEILDDLNLDAYL